MSRIVFSAIALPCAVTLLIMGFYPEWDLYISSFFWTPEYKVFPLVLDPHLVQFRRASMWIVWALALLPVVAVARKLLFPSSGMLISGRATLTLVVTLVVGPLFLVNTVLKPYWGRPRPYEVRQFSGTEEFVSWWDPAGTCRGNCSFVTGESSAAYWTLAPATVLAPPTWKPLAAILAIAFGTLVGIVRVAFGGHFATDVIASCLLITLIVWIAHEAVYRYRKTRLSDEQIEGALAAFAERIRRSIVRLWRA